MNQSMASTSTKIGARRKSTPARAGGELALTIPDAEPARKPSRRMLLPPEVTDLAPRERPEHIAPPKRARKQPGDPEVYITELTPDYMATLLKYCNVRNRYRKDTYINGIVQDMLHDRFEGLNGDTVCLAFDDAGEPIIHDGQNRMLSAVKAGKTIRTIVVVGVRMQTQETKDTGASRKVNDDLVIHKEQNISTLAGIIDRLAAWDGAVRMYGHGNYKGRVTAYRPTKPERLRIMYNPDGTDTENAELLRLSAKTGMAVYTKLGVSSACLGFGCFLFSKISREDAEWFFARLYDGKLPSDVDGHPVFTLRETLRSMADADKGNVAKRTPESKYAAILIKGWNGYRDNVRIHKYGFRTGGVNPEIFPEPH